MMDEFGQWMMVLTNYHNFKCGFKRNMKQFNFFYNGWIQGNGTTFELYELYAMDKPQGILKMCNNLNNLDNGWK